MLLFLAHVSAHVPLHDPVALLLVAKRYLMKRKRPRKKHLQTTAKSPIRMRMRMPTMMMSRRPSCHFFISFLALDDKGGVKISFMYSFGRCINFMRFF
jgi:hypothetical protein